MDSNVRNCHSIEEICLYLISHRPSWITDDTPRDLDEWQAHIENEAEIFAEWTKKTEDDTYIASLMGWHGIYFFEDSEYDPYGFFIDPKDAEIVIWDHGYYKENEDIEVTQTISRPFTQLSEEEKRWVKEKIVGRFIHLVLDEEPHCLRSTPSAKEAYEVLDWVARIEKTLEGWTAYSNSLPSGMSYLKQKQTYRQHFGLALPDLYNRIPAPLSIQLISMAIEIGEPLPESLSAGWVLRVQIPKPLNQEQISEIQNAFTDSDGEALLNDIRVMHKVLVATFDARNFESVTAIAQKLFDDNESKHPWPFEILNWFSATNKPYDLSAWD